MQEAMNHAVTNWCKTFLRDTNAGLRSISQAASMGVQGDLMSNERWGRECMLQLQEDENWNKPTATTWAAEFLLTWAHGSGPAKYPKPRKEESSK